MKSVLQLTNDIQDVPRLGEWVEQIGEQLELPMATVFNLNLALEEAVVNVMNYAYPGEVGRPVTLTAQKGEDRVFFTIEDEGVPFDPTQQEEPDLTLDADERPIGGLGIFLIRQTMSDVSYERRDNKNILKLTL